MGLLGWFNTASSLVSRHAVRFPSPAAATARGGVVHHVQGQEEVNNIMKNLDEGRQLGAAPGGAGQRGGAPGGAGHINKISTILFLESFFHNSS